MIITIVVIFLICALCGGIFVSLNTEDIASGFVILYQEEEIFKDTENLYFDGETQIEVKQFLNGQTDVEVEIIAIESEDESFCFKVDGITYYWNHVMVGKNLTEYLLKELSQPKETGGNAVIKVAGSVPEIITQYVRDSGAFSGLSEVDVPTVPEGDLFKMQIKVGAKNINLSFLKGVRVASMDLSSSEIVF